MVSEPHSEIMCAQIESGDMEHKSDCILDQCHHVSPDFRHRSVFLWARSVCDSDWSEDTINIIMEQKKQSDETMIDRLSIIAILFSCASRENFTSWFLTEILTKI